MCQDKRAVWLVDIEGMLFQEPRQILQRMTVKMFRKSAKDHVYDNLARVEGSKDEVVWVIV